MVEKVIILENISLPEFLGVANRHIALVSEAFPQAKIVSRGNEIRIKGTAADIIKINDVIIALIEHYHNFGKLSPENVQSYLHAGDDIPSSANAVDRSHTGPDEVKDTKDDVIIYGTRGVIVRAKTANQQRMVEAVRQNDIVFALGPAGTGKTFMAVALAVRALKNKEVKKIIITRPAVEAGENLGFLPGDLKEKIDPYLRPIYDALDEMVPAEKLKFYQENRIIEIAPLAYMRGRTLQSAFILLDEAQNTTPSQIKMFLTRMGPDSKVIITGDTTQIDLARNQRSGLIDAIEVLKDIKGIGFVKLDASDVVRHRLVRQIINAYEKAGR